ncbi:M24 family metallopeptidase [Phycisphaera mikurensis]|uniref:M24 family metallopeptidase n=1 Tax=Phycisphaera mikurensis TaxID=547188 RepID=UPI0009466C74|nr:Xaa-Pro peptidase family protein [Phycisphaera mikurensis]MBB6440351.1 Xaa-Pro aminopeptidase [Phycisphaera mikurensis]
MPRPTLPLELKSRLKPLQRRVKEAGLDAALLNLPLDLRYLTGFVGDDSWLLVPARGGAVILTDARFAEQVEREAPGTRAVIRKGLMAEAVAGVIGKRGYAKLGLQETGFTLEGKKRLKKGLRSGFRGAGRAPKLVAFEDGLASQRALKTPEEIEKIRAAGELQQRAFEEIVGGLAAGQQESAVAGLLEYRMRERGADGAAFHTIVAADANAALPHAIPGPAKLRASGFVLIDWGARLDGYCADMTRVVALRRFSRKMADVYDAVLEAQEAAIAAIAPGVRLRDVDKAARDLLTARGYGEAFGHGLGHGLGLNVHEDPRLSPLAPKNGRLEVGHVVTVEPGVYLPGIGGVRIEDDVAVVEGGKDVLTTLPKQRSDAELG